MKTKCESHNVISVLLGVVAFLNEQDEIVNHEIIAERLDAMLDDLCDEDFFGTEAQCDPRGDQRE